MKFLLRINTSTFLYWRQVQKLYVARPDPQSSWQNFWCFWCVGRVGSVRLKGTHLPFWPLSKLDIGVAMTCLTLEDRMAADRQTAVLMRDSVLGLVGAGWVLKKMLVKNLYCHRKWNMKRFSHARHLNNNAKPSPSYESLKRRGEVVWLVCASGIYWTSSMLLINSYVTHSIIGLIHKSYWVSRVNKC